MGGQIPTAGPSISLQPARPPHPKQLSLSPRPGGTAQSLVKPEEAHCCDRPTEPSQPPGVHGAGPAAGRWRSTGSWPGGAGTWGSNCFKVCSETQVQVSLCLPSAPSLFWFLLCNFALEIHPAPPWVGESAFPSQISALNWQRLICLANPPCAVSISSRTTTKCSKEQPGGPSPSPLPARSIASFVPSVLPLQAGCVRALG